MLSHYLVKIVNAIDCFTEYLGKTIACLTVAMVFISFAIVLFRYAFNLGWVAAQESVLYLHGLVFMLGAAYTLKHDGHVRVDIFYQKFSLKAKALVNFFGTLFLLMPVAIFIFVISYDYVSVSWKILEKSPEAGGLPFVFFSKSYLLLFAVTVVLQGFAELCRNGVTLLNADEEKSVDENASVNKENQGIS